MPAGVDWLPYLKVAIASFLSAAAGSQVVHMYYKPDLTIPETPPERGELAIQRKAQQAKQEDVQQLSNTPVVENVSHTEEKS